MPNSRIRAIRRELDISGTTISNKLGISAQYYYDIEKGKRNLSAEMAAQLAKVFNVTTDYLLGLTDQKHGNQIALDLDSQSIREMTNEEVMRKNEQDEIRYVEKALEQQIQEARDKNTYEGHIVEKELTKIKNEYPSWATSKDIRDFKKMLEEDAPVMFDGVPIEGEARQRVIDVLTGLFWEAKEMNKKTYGRKKRDDSSGNDK